MQTALQDLTLRSPEAADQESLASLFETSFHHRRSSEHWRWKYSANPFAPSAATIGVTATGEVVSHYGGYALRWVDRQRSESLIGYQIGDIMSARWVRRHGHGASSVMAQTSEHFYNTLCTDKVDYCLGFNTASSKRFSLLFMRATPVGDAPFRSARPEQLQQHPHASRYRVRRILDLASDTGRSFDRLFDRVAADYGLLVERKQPWLQWRYLDHPDQPRFRLYAAYRWRRLIGWAVFRQHGQTLRWCDALIDLRHPGCLTALLTAAQLEVRAAGEVEVIEGWFPDRPQQQAEELDRLGFARCSEPNGIGMVGVGHKALDMVERLRGSYFTWGDSDLP